MPMSELVHSVLQPASIAVVGASDNPDRIGGRPLRILAERGFKGEVYPVNPKYRVAQGLPCYPDIESLPPGVELFIFCLAAEAATDGLARAARRGARAAVMFSGGFAEAGERGAELQRRLTQIAREHDLALVGPNTLGVASFANASFATFATTLATLPAVEPGDIALVSQSGGTAFNLFTEAYWAGARFSHVIATGNEAGLTFSDYLTYLAKDPHTRAVIGYLEGVADGRRFAEALEALRAAGKPLFLIKTGVSERGSASVASHTAQLSGDDGAFDSVFARYGVTRLDSMDEVVDVARALSVAEDVGAIAVATNSGGATAYLADACERYGVPLADLQPETRRRLAEVLPDFAGLNNPVDFTAQVINDRALLGRTLEILDADTGVDALLVFLGSMEYLADTLRATLREAADRLRSPLLLSWLGVRESVRAEATETGMPISADPVRLVRGLGLVRSARAAVRAAPGGSPPPTAVAIASADAVTAPAAAGTSPSQAAGPTPTPRRIDGGRTAYDEHQTMDLVQRLGIGAVATPNRRVVSSAAEAVTAGIGYPCVLKLLDPFLAHRAKVGGVRTAIADERQLVEAFDDMRRRHQMTRALLVEQVPAGPELIVGVLRDQTFGSRAVIGSGGVWANELGDVRTLVPPYDDHYVQWQLQQLRLAQRLSDAGGEALVPAVAGLLRGLAELLESDALRITEIECNPVLVHAHGITVVDALAFTDRRGEP